MRGAELIIDALGRNRDALHVELADLTPSELISDPQPAIGWLAWHLIRVQDSQISELAGHPQRWIGDVWHARFGMAPDPKDYGPAHTHTRAQATSFGTDVATLLAYHDAVFSQSTSYLGGLSEADLDRVLDDPRFDPRPTVGVRLVSVINDNMQHVGQVIYQKACLRDGSWFPNPSNR